MDKLIVPDGGMPLEGDDIRWMYTGVEDAFKALMFGLGPSSGNFIISGCTVSLAGVTASITEGYVMLNWEVCYCPAHSATVTNLSTSSLKVEETYDVSGSEVFADSITRDTYAKRRAKISEGLNSGVEIVLANGIRIYYSAEITDYNSDWEAFSGIECIVGKQGNVGFIRGKFTGGTLSTYESTGGFGIPGWAAPSEEMDVIGLANGTDPIPVRISAASLVYFSGTGTPDFVILNVVYPLL